MVFLRGFVGCGGGSQIFYLRLKKEVFQFWFIFAEMGNIRICQVACREDHGPALNGDFAFDVLRSALRTI